MIFSHRLPWRSFDALCTGDADGGDLSILASAQRSKHLLLLRLVLDRLPPGSPHLRPSLELLADIHDRQRSAFDEVFGYPYVAAGLVHSLRSLRAGHDPAPVMSFLAATALTAAIRAGREAALDGVPVTGPIHLPTLGTAAAPPHDRTVRLATTDGLVMIGDVPVDLADEADAAGWTRIRRLGDTWPLFDDVDPYRETGGLSVAHRVSAGDFATWRAGFTEAMSLLRDRHPARADQVAEVVRTVTPLVSLRPGQGRSATAWQAYGAVLATAPTDTVSWAVTLIHETHHSVLNGLLDLVDLHDQADGRLYYSPWRADPRPLRGLLHGCYAFLVVADFWSRECAHPESGPRAEFEFHRIRMQLRTALDALDGAGSLTGDGHHIVARLVQRLESIGAGPRREPAYSLACLVDDDHRLSWRLRVMTPDPAAIDAAAAAWRLGSGPPALPVAARLTATAETFALNDRIRRFSRIARQDPAPVVDDYAEDHLVDRDYQAAAKAFSDSIRSGADDVSTWTGLALAGSRLDDPGAGAWRHQPELVRAVYQALAGPVGPPPDPLLLAGWLAEGLGG